MSAIGTFPVRHRGLILVGLVVAALLEVMDTTIINVALPQMAGSLGVTSVQIAWVSTGYILANAVVLPMTAWLSERLGRRQYLLASILLFTVASFLCGLSHFLIEIVFWRIVQGAAGAALISTAQAVVVRVFPKEQQGAVQSVFGLSLLAAPAIAPWLGGLITDHYSWPWVFFVNLPIGALAAVLIGFFYREPRCEGQRTSVPADGLGIFLLVAGMGSLQYVLEEGQRQDWFSDRSIVILSITAAVSLTGLIVWELWPANRSPLVDLRIYRERSLSSGVSLNFAAGFGMYGIAFLLPQFTQMILGLTPTAAGAALIPEGVATIGAVAVCGLLLNRKADPRPLIGLGLVLAGAGAWLMTLLTAQSGIEDMWLPLILEGAGIGFLFIPVSLVAFADLEGAQIEQGAAQLGLGRQLGGAIGVALLGTTFARMTAEHRAVLVSHIVAGSPPLMGRLSVISGSLVSHGYSLAQAQLAALKVVDNAVQAQAMTLSYTDAFWLVCISYLLSLPLILSFRKPREQKQQHR